MARFSDRKMSVVHACVRLKFVVCRIEVPILSDLNQTCSDLLSPVDLGFFLKWPKTIINYRVMTHEMAVTGIFCHVCTIEVSLMILSKPNLQRTCIIIGSLFLSSTITDPIMHYRLIPLDWGKAGIFCLVCIVTVARTYITIDVINDSKNESKTEWCYLLFYHNQSYTKILNSSSSWFHS